MKAGFVAICGWTNVGKSTLLNRLVGEKLAAVADAAQTTRHRITGVLHGERGQIVFVDTPGFHHPRERMNRAMVDAARETLTSVDLAFLLVDAARGQGAGDAEAASWVRQAKTPAIVVLNKIDAVVPRTALLPMIATVASDWGIQEIVPVSARTGEGCDRLLEVAYAMLPEAEPPFPDDVLTTEPARSLAAERVREKLLRFLRQELPHATAVLVGRWATRADGLVEIEARILVERDSQKGIVIGKGGENLKRVGTEARAEIESLLDAKVFLELRVEVRPDWRNDPRTLRELGIG